MITYIRISPEADARLRALAETHQCSRADAARLALGLRPRGAPPSKHGFGAAGSKEPGRLGLRLTAREYGRLAGAAARSSGRRAFSALLDERLLKSAPSLPEGNTSSH